MKVTRVFVASLIPFAALALSTSVGAQIYDHLNCYKVHRYQSTSPVNLSSGIIDLDPRPNLSFPPSFFEGSGCRISGKAKYVCIPFEKRNEVHDIQPSDATLTPFDGQDLTDVRLCYTVRCPVDPVIPSGYAAIKIFGQFGAHGYKGFHSSLLCTKGVVVDLPQCGDPLAPAPQCDGICNINTSCQTTCGGGANADKICTNDSECPGSTCAACKCVPHTINSCQQVGLQCTGECGPGRSCASDVDPFNQQYCGCFLNGPPCASATDAPSCDGFCGADEVCTSVNADTSCTCVPIPSRDCGQVAGPPNCWGDVYFGVCKAVGPPGAQTCQECTYANPCPP